MVWCLGTDDGGGETALYDEEEEDGAVPSPTGPLGSAELASFSVSLPSAQLR